LISIGFIEGTVHVEFELKKIIKSLLFSTSEGVSLKDIQSVINRHRHNLTQELEKASPEEKEAISDELEKIPQKISIDSLQSELDSLKKELEDNREVFRIIESPNGYAFAVVPEYSNWVRLLRNEDRPIKLSSAAMETLALVAYRQPVTRAEVEMIRGVSVDSALTKLLDQDLIYVKGQANLPGKPRLYATTDKFLSFCGVSSLEDLPSSDIISPEKLNELVKEANKRELYSDQDLGLPEEEESQDKSEDIKDESLPLED